MIKMKHAIIGCGRVAPNHVYGVNQSKVEIKWCCDVIEKKAKNFSKSYGIKKYTINYHNILNDKKVTSVSICTDHKSHSLIAIDALNAKKHVVIEKPLAINVVEAKKVIEAAEKNNRVLTVCFQHRFDPLIQEIKKCIDNRVLGKVTAINVSIQCSKDAEYYSGWRGKKRTEGGSTLINQGIHTLDLLIWFFGQPEVLDSYKDTLKFTENFETEDTLVSIMKFDNRALCSFLSTNTSVVEWDSYIEIIGTKGRLSFTTDFPNLLLKCNLDDKYSHTVQTLKSLSDKRFAPPPSMNYYGVSHKDVFADFFQCLKNHKAPFITGLDGLKTLEIVEKIYKKGIIPNKHGTRN